jgi:diacylglycerol O-acyltransferase
LDEHFSRIDLPAPGDRAALQKLAGELMSTPLDFSRPLWHYHFVEHYGSGSAIIARLHHCIADGLALVQVLLSMTDTEPDAAWVEPVKAAKKRSSLLASMLKPAVKAVSGTLNITGTLLDQGLETLAHPSRVFDGALLGASGALALSKLLLIDPDPQTVLKGKCGVSKRTVWSEPIKLELVKAVGKVMGNTVNDVLVAAAVGALGRYMERRGGAVEGVNIRAMVPVNLRPPDDLEKLGNRFGLVLLSLPVGIKDPLRRLQVLKRRMDAIKESPEAVVAFGILNAIGMTPVRIERILTNFFGAKTTLVMTNVPGPREVLYLAGKPLRGIMFWVPQPAQLGMGISILSYAGDVVVGVATDAGLVPDPETIIEDFDAVFEQMKHWAAPSRPVRRKSATRPRAVKRAVSRVRVGRKKRQPA